MALRLIGHRLAVAGLGIALLLPAQLPVTVAAVPGPDGAASAVGQFALVDPIATAVDGGGGTVVAGGFRGTAVFGDTTLVSTARQEIFVARLAPSGTWSWAVRVAGEAADTADVRAVAVDKGGNVYVTGRFSGRQAFGSTLLTSTRSGGVSAMYVAKLSPQRTWLWARKQPGGYAGDGGVSLALDRLGRPVVVGEIGGRLMVARLSTKGKWRSRVWVPGAADGALALDRRDNVYLTGSFSGRLKFGRTTLVAVQSDPERSARDVFVAKLRPAGSWAWAVRGGGTSDEQATAIARDPKGNLLVTGVLWGPSARFGTSNVTSQGLSDVFVAKLDSRGRWRWAVAGGGADYDAPQSIAVAAAGWAVVTGYVHGTATFGSSTVTGLESNGAGAFVARVGPTGAWAWATTAGPPEEPNFGWSVQVTSSGVVEVTGGWPGSLDVGPTTSASGWLWVSRLSPSGTWIPVVAPS